MSLINEALNKSRDDKVPIQENVSLGAGASGTQSTEYKGRKGVKRRKTSVLSISILGTILACSIGFYFVSSFTGLIPQFNSGKHVEIQLKDDVDFALNEKVIEAAPVPLESIHDMPEAETQHVEHLEGTHQEAASATPQLQVNEHVEPEPSSVIDTTQPTQEGEHPVHEISPDLSSHVEVQTIESSETETVEIEPVELAPHPLGEVEQETQTLPEQQQNNEDEWYATYHFGMGVFHQRNGEFERAIEEYNKVIEYDPDNAEVHINFGVIYKDEGDLDKAVEEYKKALAIDPWLDVGHNNLGVVYFLKGNYAEAIKNYQKAAEINPKNLESYINLGIAYGVQKRNVEALRAFQTASSINPRHAEAHYNLAVIYDENDEIEKALLYYSNFLELYHATKSELIDKVKSRINVLSSRLKAKNIDVQ